MKIKHPFNPEYWQYIKNLQPKARYIHVSKLAKMIPADPEWPKGPQKPWIEETGVSLHMHRTNKRVDKDKEFYLRTSSHRHKIKWLMNMPSNY